jgi:hypothetical protein
LKVVRKSFLPVSSVSIFSIKLSLWSSMAAAVKVLKALSQLAPSTCSLVFLLTRLAESCLELQ